LCTRVSWSSDGAMLNGSRLCSVSLAAAILAGDFNDPAKLKTQRTI